MRPRFVRWHDRDPFVHAESITAASRIAAGLTVGYFLGSGRPFAHNHCAPPCHGAEPVAPSSTRRDDRPVPSECSGWDAYILRLVSRASLALKRAASAVATVVFVATVGCSAGEHSVDFPGRIAFVSARGDNTRILVVETDGRVRPTVVHPPAGHESVAEIAWSPDGRRIVYSGGGARGADLFLTSPGNAQRRRVTGTVTDDLYDDLNPSWSPDGRKIVFDRYDDGYNWVYVIDADGSGLRRLTENFNYHPEWTPDGRISYVDRKGRIWVMNADGSGKRLLVRRPTIRITGYESHVMSWAPDGTQLAFTTGSAVWVVHADGTGRRELSEFPIWSPDGQRIAFVRGDPDTEIFVANADGTGAHNLTDNRVGDFEPTWSPDGGALAFVSSSEGETDIYVMTASGDGERNVSNTPGEDSSPTWSPSPT
jgi:TolB protein